MHVMCTPLYIAFFIVGTLWRWQNCCVLCTLRREEIPKLLPMATATGHQSKLTNWCVLLAALAPPSLLSTAGPAVVPCVVSPTAGPAVAVTSLMAGNIVKL